MRASYLRKPEEEKKIMQALAEHLNYDPNTGVFTWKTRVSYAMRAGMVAGSVNDLGGGYRRILRKGKQVMAHRMAWFLHYGEIPALCIDHINGNRDDNRISNLRSVDEVLNQKNRKSHRSGRLPGTYLHSCGAWHARINHNGKVMSLGYHKSEKRAYAAYLSYAKKHGIKLLEEQGGLNGD